MATITDSAHFITVTTDEGRTIDFNKSGIKYSCNENFFIIKDNSGSYVNLPYLDEDDNPLITDPVSSDIYDLRDQLTTMINPSI